MDQDSVEIEENCVSLENLICQSSSSSGSTQLSQRERLPLAAVLASSLLQLHATPWLPTKWCTQSIYFSRLCNAQHSSSVINIEHPYVISKIGHTLPLDHPRSQWGVHPDLLALGIILLELSERKSFSDWTNRNYATSPPEELIPKADFARKWFDEAEGNMSTLYATAVKHCLNSAYLESFGSGKMMLTDVEFKDAVYRGIVCLLEQAYSEFITPIDSTKLRL
jgi:hypothetical protein